MPRPSFVVLVAALLATLLACGAPGTRGEPVLVLGPYAVARSNVAPPVRMQPVSSQEARAGNPVFHDTHRACSLRGSHSSC